MNTEDFRPLLMRNLKELLPDNTQVRGSLFSNIRGGAEAFIIVRFNDEKAWANWVLDGFKEESGQPVARALEIWQGKTRPALFDMLTKAEWKKRPGWACNRPDHHGGWHTPNHYFRYSEFDYKKHQYGSWHDGPSDVEGFCKEMKHQIDELDPRPFGDLDLSGNS